MINQINSVYRRLDAGGLDVVRATEGNKNTTFSDEVKLKVVRAVLGGITQKEASIRFKMSEYTVTQTMKKYRSGELTE